DGIRDRNVTGVQTCALPISHIDAALERMRDNGAPADLLKTLGFLLNNLRAIDAQLATIESEQAQALPHNNDENELADDSPHGLKIGRASCRAGVGEEGGEGG